MHRGILHTACSQQPLSINLKGSCHQQTSPHTDAPLDKPSAQYSAVFLCGVAGGRDGLLHRVHSALHSRRSKAHSQPWA